jgi:hypothetical protein
MKFLCMKSFSSSFFLNLSEVQIISKKSTEVITSPLHRL